MNEKRKKKRYECTFKTEWGIQFKWLKPVLSDKTRANCQLCKKEFSIGNQGLHQVFYFLAFLIILFFITVFC